MVYTFDKKIVLPKGKSFALKRSVLEKSLESNHITNINCIYYRYGGTKPNPIVLWAHYCGDAKPFNYHAQGMCSITQCAVPAKFRKEIETLIISKGLPVLCAWLLKSKTEGNVWKAVDHTIYFQFKDADLNYYEE